MEERAYGGLNVKREREIKITKVKSFVEKTSSEVAVSVLRVSLLDSFSANQCSDFKLWFSQRRSELKII